MISSPFVSENFEEQITIKELAQKFVKTSDYEQRKNLGASINPLTVDLLISCGKSTRFGNIKICALREILDFEKPEQFVAMAFIYNNDIYVTFRGTDDYIVGWREDFNIAWQKPIPAQEDAMVYIKDAAEYFTGELNIIDKKGCIIHDEETTMTSLKGVFVGGDAATGAATVPPY